MKSLAEVKESISRLKEWAEGQRAIKRASMGLPIEDDKYPALVDPSNIRERTRVSKPEAYAHAYGRMLYETFGELFISVNGFVEEEDHYFISIDGESRREYILERRKDVMLPNQPITLPQVETQRQTSEPMPQEGKKK